MTQMISLHIYRTISFTFSGTQYTVRCAESNDKQEHAFMVSNDTTNQQNKYHFSADVAASYKHYNDEDLKSEVIKIIQSDIENGRI